MCDLHSKFEEDRTNTAVDIKDDSYFGQTDGRTLVISYLSNAVHCIGQTISLLNTSHVLMYKAKDAGQDAGHM